MSILQGLSSTSRGLVTDDFRRRSQGLDPAGNVEDLKFGRSIDLHPLRAVVEEAMRRFKPKESDDWLGPRVHATLRLTRREAADKRVWEYLTVVEFADYVRWRWESDKTPEEPIPLDRYLGEDSKNSFARLWWACELTRNGGNYDRCVKALSDSRFSVSWLHLKLMHHRAAALAVVDFLNEFGGEGTTDQQGQTMAKAVNIALRTVSLDALVDSPEIDVEAVGFWTNAKIDETMMMEELPTGPDEAPIPDSDIAIVRNFLDELAARIGLE